jgi:hypothetical protein
MTVRHKGGWACVKYSLELSTIVPDGVGSASHSDCAEDEGITDPPGLMSVKLREGNCHSAW